MVKVEDFEVPEGLYYTKDWMWVKIESGKVRCGITDFAQQQLNEVVFAELPSAGDKAVKDEPFGTVESVKSVSDLVAPVSGEIVEVNAKVGDSPEILNDSPYDEGWIVVISASNLEEELKSLMDFEKAVEWHKELSKES